MQRFNVPSLGRPPALFSHAAQAHAADLLSIAGMLGEGDAFEAQCESVYGRILQVLRHAGVDWASVLQFTVYLTQAEDMALFNAWRASRYPALFDGGSYPPSTLVVVSALAGQGRRIEVQTLAVREAPPESGTSQ